MSPPAQNEKKFICPETSVSGEKCTKGYTSKASLDAHRRKSHPGSLSMLRCQEPGCNEEFADRSNLTRHVKNRHGVNRRIIRCEVCQHPFDRVDNYRRHVAKLHQQREEEDNVPLPAPAVTADINDILQQQEQEYQQYLAQQLLAQQLRELGAVASGYGAYQPAQPFAAGFDQGTINPAWLTMDQPASRPVVSSDAAGTQPAPHEESESDKFVRASILGYLGRDAPGNDNSAFSG